MFISCYYTSHHLWQFASNQKIFLARPGWVTHIWFSKLRSPLIQIIRCSLDGRDSKLKSKFRLDLWRVKPELKLTHWGRDKMAAVSQTTFSYAFSWMKMLEFRFRFHWSLFLRVQLTIFQHWFRQWLGAGQATSLYLNPWWLVYWGIYASLGLNELRQNNTASLMIKYHI